MVMMLIEPKIRGFICTTAHPVGCAKNVEEQIGYVSAHPKPLHDAPKKVLVIGASTGYGLASRIEAAFGMQAETLGVFFERPADGKRTASAGWYNTAAFEKLAHQKGMYAKSVNGDAFSKEIKQQTMDLIKKDWGTGSVDLVVYSLASPVRTHPETGQVFRSVLKTIGQTFSNKTVDVTTGEVKEITIEASTEEEQAHTVAVMGGEDWQMWMEALQKAGLLAEGVKTVAYSYLGPQITVPIYSAGTIGKAKEHLQATVKHLDVELSSLSGKAYISVNKALVTQASSAIPIVPLYISLLYKVMKEKNCHEGCIEQMHRLFTEHLYAAHNQPADDQGRLRVDDWEMRPDIQSAVIELWQKVTTENLTRYSDVTGYNAEFHRLFGFGLKGVDYSLEVDPIVGIPSIVG